MGESGGSGIMWRAGTGLEEKKLVPIPLFAADEPLCGERFNAMGLGRKKSLLKVLGTVSRLQ